MAGVKDKDKGYRALIVRARDLAHSVPVRVGIHDADGGKAYKDGTTVLQVATWQEFGTETIPERSFLRAWFDIERVKIQASMVAISKAILSGKYTREQGLNLLGLRWVGEIQKRMSNRIPPPLAPATIARKGSDVPLIDTGQLRASIKHSIGSGKR